MLIIAEVAECQLALPVSASSRRRMPLSCQTERLRLLASAGRFLLSSCRRYEFSLLRFCHYYAIASAAAAISASAAIAISLRHVFFAAATTAARLFAAITPRHILHDYVSPLTP